MVVSFYRHHTGESITDEAGIAIYYFVSKRLEFRSLLKTSNSGLDTGHFIRLLCLASMDIAVAVPLSIYLICINSVDLQPYNWTEVHRDWSEILQVPSSVWMSDSRETIGMSLFRYIPSVLAFALFALIGMTEDSIGRYMKFGAKIRKLLPGGRRPQ
jgi:pheromone a factor receptor